MAKIRRENVYPMWGLFYRLKMSSLKTGSELNFYPSVMSPQHLIQNKFGIKELIRWISSVQSFSCVQLFVTPWAAACQASPSITNSRSFLKLMSIYWVRDAIQPSHPLLSPSPPGLNFSQHQGLFQWVSSLHQVAKVLELQLRHQSLQWISYMCTYIPFLWLSHCLFPFLPPPGHQRAPSWAPCAM